MNHHIKPWQRTTVHALFALWFGGFTFYAAIVIPTGARVLGGHEVIGFVTAAVSAYLNYLGLTVLALLFLFNKRQEPIARGQLVRLWWLMLIAQGILVCLHPWLASHLDTAQKKVLEPDAFYAAHRVYLIVATGLWITGALMLHRLVNGAPHTASPPAERSQQVNPHQA